MEIRKVLLIPLFTLAPEGTPVKIPGLKIRYFYGLYGYFFLVMFGNYITIYN